LGNANTGSNSSFFTRVKQPRGVTYKDFNIYAEYNVIESYTVLAVDANDNLYAWGGNFYSQCGFANYPNLNYYGTPLKINFN
jgi:alpha-tubulin suppressor-like RCC1 family protein